MINQKIYQQMHEERQRENKRRWEELQDTITAAKEAVPKSKRRKQNQWNDEECGKIQEDKSTARLKILQNGSQENKAKYAENRRKAKQLFRKKVEKANCRNQVIKVRN